MRNIILAYIIIIAAIFIYIPKNKKIQNIFLEKYGPKKGGGLLILFRLTGIILMIVFVLKLIVIFLE
jgi:hypothetical protein